MFTTHVGRDKLLRMIFMALMAIVPAIDKKPHLKVLAAKLMALATSIGMARKVMRFGLTIPILMKILNASRK